MTLTLNHYITCSSTSKKNTESLHGEITPLIIVYASPDIFSDTHLILLALIDFFVLYLLSTCGFQYVKQLSISQTEHGLV